MIVLTQKIFKTPKIILRLNQGIIIKLHERFFFSCYHFSFLNIDDKLVTPNTIFNPSYFKDTIFVLDLLDEINFIICKANFKRGKYFM